MRELSGKVVLVTGAGSGIGLGIARAFARSGTKLVLADINSEKLAIAEAEIAGIGADVLAITFDVSDIVAWQNAMPQVVNRFGGVDILCNNAGVGPASVPMHDISDDDWRWIFGINVDGVRNGIRTWLPSMIARNTGHIVNTASILGLFASTNCADYVACKFAVVGISEALRQELHGTGIGVSVICPGFVATNLATERPLIKLLTAGVDLSEANPLEGRSRRGSTYAIDPDRIGTDVVRAVRDEAFYILPQPEYRSIVNLRFQQIEADFPRCAPTQEDVSVLGAGVLRVRERRPDA